MQVDSANTIEKATMTWQNGASMMSAQTPPIDRELGEAAGPMLAATGAFTAMSDADFMAMIGNTQGLPDEVLSHGGRVTIRHIEVPGGAPGVLLPALIATPADAAGPLPCIYYTANGGKMYQGDTAGLMATDTAWVAELGIVLVSISPRVGPEHEHPAQVEDAYAGLQWIHENATDLGVDAQRIVIMGKSGGGGIAAATALYARDQGGPSIARQMLIYPMLDDRTDTVSSTYDAPGWNAHANRVGWTAILGEAVGGPDVSEYAAAARAIDLSGLPPAYVEVGGSEVFRDEDLDYARRLLEAHVPVELHVWMGGFHGFEIIAPGIELARACLDARTSFIRRSLHDLADAG